MNSGVDLHIHTVYSDGTDTPDALIKTLSNFNIGTFAISDHDTLDGCRAVLPLVPNDMKMFCSVEFSCKTEFKKCHILGLGIDIDHPSITDAVNAGKLLREAKLYSRLEHLKNAHRIVLSNEDIETLKAENSVGKPHIARILVRASYAESIDEAIKKYLTFRGNNDKLDAAFAINAIKSAGGIPIWAHPLGGEGEKRLSEEDYNYQLSLLMSAGISGLECYYSRYTKTDIDRLINTARKHGLLISGGSDYHGENKNISPGELNSDNSEIDLDNITVLSKLCYSRT